ncbi:hypothetical protein ERJ75_000356600 [Trypanosoma vivax]|nr:hypothetical protein TRVL_03964 [Trypanosoma vivax]KAH8617644.1 hypothetical protein ERJ75_000356600 [Trypanosoma vivax]
MGAVPSRETLERGLHIVRPPQGSGGSGGSHKKHDIVLIPLIKKFFTSPDCPLFVQFHRARCDPGVRYYFRRPGNPGDLSRIPTTDDNGDKSAHPSREALYHGVVERVDEMLFDTDEEMRQAYEHSIRDTELTSAYCQPGRVKKRVLPILCAVAFRYSNDKLTQLQNTVNNSPNSGTPVGGKACYLQAVLENGVALGDSVVNIVGCFGFVPMETEGMQVSSSPTVSHNFQGSSALMSFPLSRSQMPTPASQASSFGQHGGFNVHAPATRASVVRDAYEECSAHMPHLNLHDRLPKKHDGPQLARQPNVSLTLSHSSTPSYDPHHSQKHQGIFTHESAGGRGASKRGTLLRGAAQSNYDHFASLPPPVAAPLAAIVFLTKSAGEQNLSRLTFIAATTYYEQLVNAGVLQSDASQSSCSPGHDNTPLPPMETFSFSSLMTNVPILSFVYEMRCRWERFGFVSYPPIDQHSGTNSTSSLSPNSAYGNAFADGSALPMSREDFEMWITDDSMFHGRISKALAERLCLNMAKRPDVMSIRVQPPPNENSYWRFRGLVDRYNTPPTPLSEADDAAEARDVYVMGAAVIDGFDEGDVLVYDRQSRVWVANRNIPLDVVVLVAMRAVCRAAREAPPDDPGWVVEEEAVEEEASEDVRLHEKSFAEANGDAAGLRKTKRKLRRVHVHEGNFYIYSFKLNGTTYYHGIVPDFANPKKKKALRSSCVADTEQQCTAECGTPTQSHLTNSEQRLQQRWEQKQEQGEDVKEKASGFPSITAALFYFMSDTQEGDQSGTTPYLATRVRYAAIEAARNFVGSLCYCARGDWRLASDAINVADSSAPVDLVSSTNSLNEVNSNASGGYGFCFSKFPSLSALVNPVIRRKSTFVQVGREEENNVTHENQEGKREESVTMENSDAESSVSIVKRLIHDTRYVWDWGRS